MALLAKSDIDRHLAALHGWTLDGNALRKQFTLRRSTHSEGAITLKDVDGARMADRQAQGAA